MSLNHEGLRHTASGLSHLQVCLSLPISNPGNFMSVQKIVSEEWHCHLTAEVLTTIDFVDLADQFLCELLNTI